MTEYEEALKAAHEDLFKRDLLAGLKSIDINLDLIRKALGAKKKKNGKR